MILQRATQAQPSNPGPALNNPGPARPQGCPRAHEGWLLAPCSKQSLGRGRGEGWGGWGGAGGRRVLCSSAEQENSLGPLGWLPGAVQ